MQDGAPTDDEAFRAEVRVWFQTEFARFAQAQAGADTTSHAYRRAWEDHVCASGWSGLGWPREHGGRALPLRQQAIFHEEQARVGAPLGVNLIGHGILAPTLLHFGSEAHKRRFLPPILANREIWCQGYSESTSGSDLASLQCKAVRDGEHFVLHGHKIWTSFAHLAQWCFVLARTDAQLPRHKGLSMLLVDMRSPGVRVEPVVQMNGASEFNQVHFDGVRVPADHLLGGLNEGWRVAMAAASFERATYFIPRQVRFAAELSALRALAARAPASPATRAARRRALARLTRDAHVLRLKTERALAQGERGQAPGAEGSSTKLHWSEAHQRLLELAMDVVGTGAALGTQAGEPGAAWVQAYLASRAETILAGTSEIQRNIIGEQILRLPKG